MMVRGARATVVDGAHALARRRSDQAVPASFLAAAKRHASKVGSRATVGADARTRLVGGTFRVGGHPGRAFSTVVRSVKRTAEIVASLGFEAHVVVQFADVLAVSLDCASCVRARRTVVFKVGEPTARCQPGSARRRESHPPYPGRILDRRVETNAEGRQARYLLEYDVAPFVDAKYGALAPWTGHPTWARVGWTATCPSCGARNEASTQNNIVRPFENRCGCGHVFFIERREMPSLRWVDPETGAWCEAPQRFPPAD